MFVCRTGPKMCFIVFLSVRSLFVIDSILVAVATRSTTNYHKLAAPSLSSHILSPYRIPHTQSPPFAACNLQSQTRCPPIKAPTHIHRKQAPVYTQTHTHT